MSLFTSNFKQEAAALSFVALALLTCELGLRASIQRASIDVRHIRAIPKIVAGLAGARHPTFLFLGNSLTRSGVIPEVLAGTRAAGGFGKAHVALIHPDDTTISDWLYLYERFVRSKGAAPDVLLIGFAKDHLSDSHALHVDRLGGYFGGLGALPEAFSYDVPDLNGRVSYLLSSLSCAYANRDRVRTQVFASLPVLQGVRPGPEQGGQGPRADLDRRGVPALQAAHAVSRAVQGNSDEGRLHRDPGAGGRSDRPLAGIRPEGKQLAADRPAPARGLDGARLPGRVSSHPAWRRGLHP